jgi:hypothetical protein
VQRSRSFGLRGNDVETPLQFAWLASGWRVAGVGWYANRETCVVDTVVQETLYWNLKLVYPHSFTSVAKTNFFSSLAQALERPAPPSPGYSNSENALKLAANAATDEKMGR